MFPLRPLTTPGTYAQGTIATFIISTVRAKGEVQGFKNPYIRIETTDGTSTILANTEMSRAPESYYFFDWEVPSDLEPGNYYAIFSADLESQTYEKVQNVAIVANSTVHPQEVLCSNTESELMVGLYYTIKKTQEIPVENEQAKVSANGLKAVFTFDKWNVFYNRTQIYRNFEEINTGYTINYDSGEVIFSDAIGEHETITADYNFSWFSAEELSTFLSFSLSEINMVPPGSTSSLSTAPVVWYPAIIWGAAKNVYRRLIHDLAYQQPKLVYGYDGEGGGNWKDAVELFKSLKENYEKDFEQAAKNAKRNTWPGIGIVVAPEFTMPGGRCMSSDTCIKCNIDGSIFESTIYDLYKMFNNRKNIKVLSYKDGFETFSQVSKIWKSGSKKTYIVKTANSEIRLSKDHLVYLPVQDKYKAVKFLKENDIILVNNSNGFMKEKLLFKPMAHKIEDVYDIEVPETENFIGNNVVSHNSRWFRYLYKG